MDAQSSADIGAAYGFAAEIEGRGFDEINHAVTSLRSFNANTYELPDQRAYVVPAGIPGGQVLNNESRMIDAGSRLSYLRSSLRGFQPPIILDY
jgi:hypothetical protein